MLRAGETAARTLTLCPECPACALATPVFFGTAPRACNAAAGALRAIPFSCFLLAALLAAPTAACLDLPTKSVRVGCVAIVMSPLCLA